MKTQSTCQVCNKIIHFYPSMSEGKYCSYQCYHVGRVKPIRERFEKFIQKDSKTGCWFWTGGKTGIGYGAFEKARYKIISAHRLSWEIYNGQIPNGFFVLHKCDIRHCVNPKHLFLGSSKDNAVDSSQKGRHPHGEKHPLSKLTNKQVFDIRTKSGQSRKIAREYGVDPALIRRIKQGKIWKHLLHSFG